MKRRDFMKGAVMAGAVAVAPGVNIGSEGFEHDPQDYAELTDGPYEFEEYEIDVPEDWAEEEIEYI